MAISVENCMEQRCIDYYNKWKVRAGEKRADAMTVLAELYYQGHGTKKNLKKSIQYFRKAAIYQSAYAQYRLGVFFLMEDDFIDTEKGLKYLRKAANNGHAESAFLLGAIFGTGELGIKDVGESDKWLVKALKDQHAVAQKYAGYLYKTGQVDNEHYIKVNEVISELIIQSIHNEEFTEKRASSTTEIQWLTMPSNISNNMQTDLLEDVIDYLSLGMTKVISQDVNVIKASKTHCGKIFTCYQVDKENSKKL
ncbi:Sel1 domain protein repeat-containing protein [Colwellia psychrerythraea]|uniref:Sel1 domain protein repeat-containing protein n=2 Tax=Colwellia psychrerythraea TaxID=28229 RepID=A0A099KW71_COLPS|nr:Sel1 domain protein repeat-containing protein [Colwellia psychrerythraea]